MQPELLYEQLHGSPFHPFRIHLKNGESYDVVNPELTMVTRATMVVGFPAERPDVADRVVLISPTEIVRSEPLPSNGSHSQPTPRSGHES